jgi:UDP-N-acetylmuramoyl-tripeptide--D-alanyl-D-alanine ligase
MEISTAPAGYTVINDAYNANPESMRAALKALVALARAQGGRSWAVLGEMAELGAAADEEHDAVGRFAVRLDVSRLVAVGERAKRLHSGAALEGSWANESTWVATGDEALDLLRRELRPHDVVLVKASRVAGLERLAAALAEAGEGAA